MTTMPPLTPTYPRLMRGSDATLRPTCFMVTSARPGIGGTGTNLHGGFLVHGPLNVHALGPALCDGLDDLCGRSAGIPRDNVHPSSEGTKRDGLVAREELFMRRPLLKRR